MCTTFGAESLNRQSVDWLATEEIQFGLGFEHTFQG